MINKPEILKIYDPYDINNIQRKNVAIIMPSYNQYKITRKNILLLKNQTLVPDIIIVDNNSLDDTFEKLKNEFKDIILIKLKDNYGGAGAFYIGQKYAYDKGYEYIILNDNDAYPIDKDLIEELIKNSNKNTIVQPFNVDEDLENNYNFWIFHYVIFKRETLNRIGFVDYKLFLYGDEVEYYKRIINTNLKLKKLFKKYTHPFKYHSKANRVYYAIRNEIYMENIYNSRFWSFIVIPILNYYLYEPTKFKIANEAIRDLKNKTWNNSFIKRKFDLDVVYKKENLNDFIKKIENAKITYIKSPKIKEVIKNIKNKKEYSKFSFLFSDILITNAYTINTPLFNKIYFIVDFDKNKKEITYFELENKLLTKIKFLLLFFIFFIWLKLIVISLKKNCYYFKKLNENDLYVKS